MSKFLIVMLCVLAGIFTIAVPLVWLMPEVSTAIAIGYTAFYLFTIIGYAVGTLVNKVLESLGKR